MERIIQILLITAAVLMSIQGFIQRRKHEKNHSHSSFGHKHDGSVFSIDFYAYASQLRTWSPKYKAIFSMVCLLCCIICDNIYVSCAVILLMAYITVVMGGLPFRRYLSLMTIPLVFLFFGCVAIAIGFSGSPSGDFNLHLGFFYVYTSKESLWETLELIAKALGAVSSMYMLTLSTPASEIIAVLRGLHMPKLLVELMNMIYRYIFLLMDTQCRMKNAAVSRLGYCDFKTSCVSFGQIASNLLVVSLKKGNAYYHALEARCYDGELRFLEEEKTVSVMQTAGALLSVSLLLCIWRLTV